MRPVTVGVAVALPPDCTLESGFGNSVIHYAALIIIHVIYIGLMVDDLIASYLVQAAT